MTDEMIAAFVGDGVMRLPGLLPEPIVAAARDAVRRALEPKGLWRDGRWQLESRDKPAWPATAVKTARDIGHRHPEVRALFEQPALGAVIDGLLGGGAIDRTIHRHAQVLFSLPNAGPWRLPGGWPGGWHSDSPRLSDGTSPGVQAFTFLEPVAPCGGGTLVIAGSHRLLAGRGALKPKQINRLLRDEPYFHRLAAAAAAGEAFPKGSCGDVGLEVVELTGEPGDVWITDMRVLHAASPNAANRPRVMATDRYLPAALIPAISAAYGWT
ncbi:MAG TPA: phytanoyl-CoA dioxygenase family protein [Croceibacterium sp.]|nr:phytanoyl-CoA dioxygenase family protein [Croceibacterium sp.]